MLQTFCEALQEMNEKITSTDADAKSVGNSTHGFHQAFLHFDCSWLIFLRSWNCIPVRIVRVQYCAIPATQRNAIRLGRTMSYPRTVYFVCFVYFGCLWSQQSYSFLQCVLGVPKQRTFQVLTEVQKQMSSLDAEMKEARKDAEGMQQVPLPVDVRTQFSDCGWWYSRCVRLCPPVLAEISSWNPSDC